MAYEQLKDSTLPRVITAVIADIAQLFQAEVRLAKAELALNISAKFQAILGVVVAAIFGLAAILFIGQAGLFALTTRGVEAHWASLIVAFGFCILAAISAAVAMSKGRQEMTPQRTVDQVNKDIRVVKEQIR